MISRESSCKISVWWCFVLFFSPLFIFLKLPNPVVIVVMHYIGTAKTSALLL